MFLGPPKFLLPSLSNSHFYVPPKSGSCKPKKVGVLTSKIPPDSAPLSIHYTVYIVTANLHFADGIDIPAQHLFTWLSLACSVTHCVTFK